MIWPDILILIHKRINLSLSLYALPTTKIAPENGWLDYEFPSGADSAYFQGLWLLVLGSVLPSKTKQRSFLTWKSENHHPPPKRGRKLNNIGDTPIFHEKHHDSGRKVAFSGPALLADDLLQICARWGCRDV